LLEGHHIVKHFGGLTALNNIDFYVDAGEIVGLIGPNGSGKSTLFNIIAGRLKPSQGRIWFQGRDVTGWSAHQACHQGVAATFQLVQPFTHLTVLQNVLVGAVFGQGPLQPLKQAIEHAERILKLVDLADKRNVLARSLSLGQLKRLELARALATQPSLLLIDEVGAGLTPRGGAELRILLRRLRDEGVTIFGIEHSPRAVAEISDRMIVLNKGDLLAEGPPEQVVNDPRVIDAYLGE